jgi:hypothetical protein
VNKLLASLSCLACSLLVSSAEALPTGAAFDAFLEGAPTSPAILVGKLRFLFDSQVAGGACRYVTEWQNETGFVTVGQCYLDEATWLAHTSCVENAAGPMQGIVVLAPGQTCTGIDGESQPASIFQLVLAERPTDGSLEGILQYSAASTLVYGFGAVAAP